ncbi:hypothetical protein [Pseudooceanicola sp. MF1-13]|uniref:hypothetical protein n=1 Tax=Pseudooceanicola sp. MF1-13 TaxID=3379095 RepID=UPI003892A13E
MTTDRPGKSLRRTLILGGAFGLTLTACTSLKDTGQTFTVDGVTHTVYAVVDPATGEQELQVRYRNFVIFCGDMASCPEDIALQKRFIDLVYRGEP